MAFITTHVDQNGGTFDYAGFLSPPGALASLATAWFPAGDAWSDLGAGGLEHVVRFFPPPVGGFGPTTPVTDLFVHVVIGGQLQLVWEAHGLSTTFGALSGGGDAFLSNVTAGADTFTIESGRGAVAGDGKVSAGFGMSVGAGDTFLSSLPVGDITISGDFDGVVATGPLEVIGGADRFDLDVTDAIGSNGSMIALFGDARLFDGAGATADRLVSGRDTIELHGVALGTIAGDVGTLIGAELWGTSLSGPLDPANPVFEDDIDVRALDAASDLTVHGDVGRAVDAIVHAGHDRIRGSYFAADDIIGDVGTAAGTVTLTGGDDVLVGNAGADRIIGDLGAVEAGAFVFLTAGDDNLLGGSGDDTLAGDVSDTLFAQAGVIHVAGGDDTLEGGAGNDYLFGGWGFNEIDGGNNTDTVFYEGASGVTVDLGLAYAQHATGIDHIVNVENVSATAGADRLIGSAGRNRLDGREGADIVTLGAGIDRVVLRGDSAIGLTDVVTDFVRGTDKIEVLAVDFAAVAWSFQGGHAFVTLGASTLRLDGIGALAQTDFILI